MSDEENIKRQQERERERERAISKRNREYYDVKPPQVFETSFRTNKKTRKKFPMPLDIRGEMTSKTLLILPPAGRYIGHPLKLALQITVNDAKKLLGNDTLTHDILAGLPNNTSEEPRHDRMVGWKEADLLGNLLVEIKTDMDINQFYRGIARSNNLDELEKIELSPGMRDMARWWTSESEEYHKT